MKKMKRVIALFLCLLMLSSLAPISVFAEGEVPGDNDVVVTEVCGECGGSGAHTETCSLNTINLMNQNDTVVCTVCGAENCEATHVYCDTCEKYDCGLTHTTCDKCGTVDCQSTHEAWCDTCKKDSCTCEPVVAASETNDPQVGAKIWIKSGSKVYRNQSSENGHKLLGNYQVEIVRIITDENGNAVWYEFKFTNLVGEAFLHGFKYVKVENTSADEPTDTEPEDENACNCGESASENIAEHADSCPRKQYIKTLFEGKTAEEIYANWNSYDEATRTDILTMVQTYNPAIHEELKQLVDENSGSGKETTVGDISLKLQGVPDDVTLNAQTVTPKSYHEDLFDVVGSKKVVFAIDINLTNDSGEWQPKEDEPVTVSLDAASLGLSEGERIGILHDHDGTLNDLGICTVTDGKLTFTTDGFSVFYGYTVDFEYDGTWYSIGGGSDIYLYELFAQLGITRSTSSISSVDFSDSSLLAVSKKIVDGYTGRKDWHIQSLQPFDTEEIMTITFNDSTNLSINVYDFTYTTLSNNLTLNNGDIINGATVSGTVNITLNGTVTIKNQITVPSGASLKIIGNGTLKRDSSYNGRLFSVEGGVLTIEGSGITIDGGAVWSHTAVANSTREILTVTTGGDVTSSAIYIDGEGTVNLTGITMRNLYSKTQSPAIHATGTGISDTNTSITKYSVVNMTDVTIKDCANNNGQAITLFNNCKATLNNCKFTDNYVMNGYSGAIKAGGPSYFSKLDMNNCVATGNYSSGWGGVVLWAANSPADGVASKATIDGCTFKNNKARYLGGALSNEAIMEVKNTTIENNIAMAGGGIATFPFTLTETQASGGNACGLTLGGGNTIKDNTAFASGDFTPFSSTDPGADGDDNTISNQITYTGGGGGVWCYMNKPGWTCSLEIGTGNDIISNDANNVGGGVYVHKVDGQTTTLSITGAKISNNKAPNGGGVAVKDATVTIASGEIASNTATYNGGGIFVDNGTCDVSGTGSVNDNTAANGGGIYIQSGSLVVSGGVITGNNATGSFNGTTAKDATSGVGGGIYVKEGSFEMSGNAVGLHSNTASVAANDAFASGTSTTLVLPDVEAMNLAGWTGTGKPEGWFADYMGADVNYPASVIKDVDGNPTTNRGRYNYYDEDKVEVLYNTVLKTNTKAYYCLTIGTPHPGYGNLVITKTLTAPAKETQTFIFEVTGTTRKPETAYSLTVTLVIEKGETTAQVLVANIPDGTYTVTEKEAWSWRYDQTSRQFHPKDGAVISETTFTVAIENPEWVADFTNNRTDPFWLSGDSYCENWWGGENGTKVTKREEHY